MALFQYLPVYRDMPGTWRCRTGLAGRREGWRPTSASGHAGVVTDPTCAMFFVTKSSWRGITRHDVGRSLGLGLM